MVRSFIAIDIEDENIRSKIASIGKVLEATGARLKLVEPHNLHITIRFLGEISQKEVESIKQVLANSVKNFSKFNIIIEGMGAFPTISRPRVLWLGISKGKESLINLANTINRRIDLLGYKKDKEFVPHVTIARVKRFNSALINAINNYKNILIGETEVKSVRLKKSVLTPSGPIYSTLYEVKLSES